MKHTLPALIFSFFKLSNAVENGTNEEVQTSEDDLVVKVDQAKIFKSVNEMILALQETQPEQCLKLNL